MASGDEAEAADVLGGPRSSIGGAEGVVPQGRRHRSKEAHQEIVDELAQETKRVTLLDREEQQLKGQKHYSRLLFVFGVADDKKLQTTIEQEFASWRNKQEQGQNVTGLLLFLGQSAACFLEGPAEVCFKGMELFHSMSQEILPQPVMPLPPADMRTNMSRTETEPVQNPRSALMSAVRVLYFTELHGVRSSVGFCSFVSPAKTTAGGGQGNLEDGAHEFVFQVYQKFLVLCLKVQNSAGDGADSDALQGHYRKFTDIMPTPDEVALLLGKQGNEHFFSFAEFQQVFMKPFQLVLNSELLWPMPPALSY
jgi:hypothetical protein